MDYVLKIVKLGFSDFSGNFSWMNTSLTLIALGCFGLILYVFGRVIYDAVTGKSNDEGLSTTSQIALQASITNMQTTVRIAQTIIR